MKPAAGEARNATSAPMSAGVPSRPAGAWATARAQGLGHREHERRRDQAGHHRVRGHAALAELLCDRLRERDHARLRGRVGRLAEARRHRCDRGDVDYAAPASPGHRGDDGAHGVKGAGEIHAQLAFPGVGRHLGDARDVVHDAGVVDEDVDRTERALHLTGGAHHRLRIGDVDRHGVSASSERAHRLGGRRLLVGARDALAQPVVALATERLGMRIRDRDVGAGLGERERNAATDAARRARHERHSTRQRTAHGSPLLRRGTVSRARPRARWMRVRPCVRMALPEGGAVYARELRRLRAGASR
jgi:hypothetical protein